MSIINYSYYSYINYHDDTALRTLVRTITAVTCINGCTLQQDQVRMYVCLLSVFVCMCVCWRISYEHNNNMNLFVVTVIITILIIIIIVLILILFICVCQPFFGLRKLIKYVYVCACVCVCVCIVCMWCMYPVWHDINNIYLIIFIDFDCNNKHVSNADNSIIIINNTNNNK